MRGLGMRVGGSLFSRVRQQLMVFHMLAILGVGRIRMLSSGTIGSSAIGFGLRVVGMSRACPWRLRLRRSLA